MIKFTLNIVDEEKRVDLGTHVTRYTEKELLDDSDWLIHVDRPVGKAFFQSITVYPSAVEMKDA